MLCRFVGGPLGDSYREVSDPPPRMVAAVEMAPIDWVAEFTEPPDPARVREPVFQQVIYRLHRDGVYRTGEDRAVRPGDVVGPFGVDWVAEASFGDEWRGHGQGPGQAAHP